jgi:guanine deaminase
VDAPTGLDAARPGVDRDLPAAPPFTLRARVLTPLAAGGSLDLVDGIVGVDAAGRISVVGPAQDRPAAERAAAIDLRGHVLMPGLVDLHAHLWQLPNAGVGAGLDLLTWLRRYIFPMEQAMDVPAAERLGPAAFRAFAAVGTTTVLAYAAVYADSTDAAFRAADAHGIRAIIGKVMMDRDRYDHAVPDSEVLERSLGESDELCERWHGAADGRLGYAFTPRFAVTCSPELLRESASLATARGAWWQTHLSEDRGELAEVARRFPEALDYTDVYDRAGGLSRRAVLAHAIHLSEREIERIVERGARVAHCPSSNLFLASGVMPLGRYLAAGMQVGLGSDVAAGPDPSLFSVMRVGAYVQNALRVVRGDASDPLDPLDWLRMASLEGARSLGLDDAVGSLEVGKEADLIAVDPSLTDPLPETATGSGAEEVLADPRALMSRLIYRAHPDMVRAAWVRGRRLPGPVGWEPVGAATTPGAAR